jgi:hypothetical protein
MKEWTFLLQKDGDRSWLPLDSVDVEILEGRYRIVAQTDHPDTDISIRVCHLATEEDPPKRRIQKRSYRTNSNGLMVVTPFTQLQPGDWELSCFLTDPLSDLVGDMLHQAVRLRVLACVNEVDWQDSEPIDPATRAELATQINDEMAAAPQSNDATLHLISDELIANETEIGTPPTVQDLATLNVEIAQALGVSMDRLVEMTDQLSHQLIEEIFREFNLPAVVEPLASGIPSETVSSAEGLAAAASPVAATRSPNSEVPPAVVESAIDINLMQIALAQDVWMAARGEALTISGRVELLAASAVATSDRSIVSAELAASSCLEPELEGAIPQEIQIQLRDPQTSKILFHACQSFPRGELPRPFHFLCQLPDNLTTHLLLGDVLIAGGLPGAETALITLKTFHFTVTVDPEGLVEELQKVQTALTDDAEQSELPDLVTQFSNRLLQEKSRHSLDLSFLNMAAPVTPAVTPQDSEDAQSPAAQTAIAPKPQILPPQLYKPDAEQAGKRKLELPMFAGVGAKASNIAIAAPIETLPASSDSVFASSAIELESLLVSEPSVTSGATAGSGHSTTSTDASVGGGGNDGPNDEPTQTIDDSAENPPLSGNLPPDQNAEVDQSSEPEPNNLAMLDELSSPIRTAFQALNLQDKFLNRLSSMAADAELITLLKLTLPNVASEVRSEDETQSPVEVAVEPLAMSEVMAEPDTTEVVVDDPSWQAWVKRSGVRTKPTEPEQPPMEPNPLVLPLDEPIPVPMLETGIDDIVAGKTINVRVKLPNVLPKIYVKLWINDRQTRTLLDGPRWLVDFLPNGFDQLEASTQLTAPFGSLEIRIEAIAVEMQTQRESQKVILDCEVCPAEVPDELFADFEY